jgi:hypothetical protein
VRLTGSGRGAENCLALERANSMIAMASINAAGKLMTEYRRIMRHMTQTVGRPVGEAILKKTPYNRKAARLGGERRGLPSALLIGGWGGDERETAPTLTSSAPLLDRKRGWKLRLPVRQTERPRGFGAHGLSAGGGCSLQTLSRGHLRHLTPERGGGQASGRR